MLLRRLNDRLERLLRGAQTSDGGAETSAAIKPAAPLVRSVPPLPLRGAQQAGPSSADGFFITRIHLHERSRLSDKTLCLAVADNYFALQLAWLRSGACGLHDQQFTALGILQRPADASALLAYLSERHLVGSTSLGRVHCEPFKDALRGLRRLPLSLLDGYEARLCQLLRLHRAEYARYGLFNRYIDEQAHEQQVLARALRGKTKGTPHQEILRREQNVAWAKKERDLPPSLRHANAVFVADGADTCPLLPAFRAVAAPKEVSLQLYPPPPAVAAAVLPAY